MACYCRPLLGFPLFWLPGEYMYPGVCGEAGCRSSSPQSAFVTRSTPTALFPPSRRNCSFSMSWSIRCPRLLNTIDRSQADLSPMRSSFVNHGCPSLLSTVIVSFSRSICLPALCCSTVITRFNATMADSDFLVPISQASCLALVPVILIPLRSIRISWVPY